MKYASIDIGTNSCRLLIAELRNDQLTVLKRDIQTTRIGAGLAASGQISQKAAERTLQCLQGFQGEIDRGGVSEYRMVATSAVREASNRIWFQDLCREKLHKPVEVISWEKEALLTYKGVEKGLRAEQPVLVVDLGGGSTELIYCRNHSYVKSLPLGAVKGAEMQITDSQVRAMLGEIEEARRDFAEAIPVFCGGTATSAVAIKYAMTEYDPGLVHGQRLSREEIEHCYAQLREMPLDKRKQIKGLQAERADIIVYGLMIMVNLMQVLQKEWAVVSESDLLEGLIWEMHETSSAKSASS
ncbi:MAG: Ppx/GppA family phosphatase [Syntrophomonadaceae bacterium]|jgi:exopolyphosphatase/guanosine-5'-triphosphate,3'-diphosphate pyrophosphatase|nr:Ppx/GppA family phosphatase [Syntrophomonadaceae bacterium]